MKKTELQSAQYLDALDPTATPCRNRAARRRAAHEARESSRMFRLVMLIGLVFCTHWFYKNQDPILANIRDHSGRLGLFFSDLVEQGDLKNTNEFIPRDDSRHNDFAVPFSDDAVAP